MADYVDFYGENGQPRLWGQNAIALRVIGHFNIGICIYAEILWESVTIHKRQLESLVFLNSARRAISKSVNSGKTAQFNHSQFFPSHFLDYMIGARILMGLCDIRLRSSFQEPTTSQIYLVQKTWWKELMGRKFNIYWEDWEHYSIPIKFPYPYRRIIIW